MLHGPYVEATAEAVAALGATEPPAAQCVRSAEELHARLDEALRDVSSVSSVSSLAARRAAASRAARALEEGVSERVWGALEGPLGLPRGGHGERTGEARPAVPLNITET